MLRTIYRSLVIGRARTSAEKTVRHLSDRQLNDIGHSKWSFIEGSVNSVINDLDAAEAKRKNDAICYPGKLERLVTLISKVVYFNFRREA